jgi:hypothetical protein
MAVDPILSASDLADGGIQKRREWKRCEKSGYFVVVSIAADCSP